MDSTCKLLIAYVINIVISIIIANAAIKGMK